MTDTTVRYPGLIRIVYCLVLLTISAGCSTTGVVDPEQATIDLDSSVVAFSVNTRKLSEYETPIRPKQVRLLYGAESIPIRLSSGKTGIQRVLLEVPVQNVMFSQLEVVVGTGPFSDRYMIDDGQRIELTPGEITYLGRLKIEDVKFAAKDDGTPGNPTAVKLVFADALAEDQMAWEQQYKIFQNRVPEQQIIGNWAGNDYLTLWIKEWAPASTSSNRRIGNNRDGPPRGTQPMGGQRESRPPGTSSPH